MKTFGSLINLPSKTKLSYQKLSSLLIGQFLTNACKEFQVFTNGGRFQSVCEKFHMPVVQTEGKYPHILECLVIASCSVSRLTVFRAGSWQHHVNILNEVSCLAPHLSLYRCYASFIHERYAIRKHKFLLLEPQNVHITQTIQTINHRE